MLPQRASRNHPHRYEIPLPFPLLLTALCVSGLTAVSLGAPLSTDFYGRSCPKAQAIVADSVKAAIAADVTLAAQILRLAFHDCFGRVGAMSQRLGTGFTGLTDGINLQSG